MAEIPEYIRDFTNRLSEAEKGNKKLLDSRAPRTKVSWKPIPFTLQTTGQRGSVPGGTYGSSINPRMDWLKQQAGLPPKTMLASNREEQERQALAVRAGTSKGMPDVLTRAGNYFINPAGVAEPAQANPDVAPKLPGESGYSYIIRTGQFTPEGEMMMTGLSSQGQKGYYEGRREIPRTIAKTVSHPFLITNEDIRLQKQGQPLPSTDETWARLPAETQNAIVGVTDFALLAAASAGGAYAGQKIANADYAGMGKAALEKYLPDSMTKWVLDQARRDPSRQNALYRQLDQFLQDKGKREAFNKSITDIWLKHRAEAIQAHRETTGKMPDAQTQANIDNQVAQQTASDAVLALNKATELTKVYQSITPKEGINASSLRPTTSLAGIQAGVTGSIGKRPNKWVEFNNQVNALGNAKPESQELSNAKMELEGLKETLAQNPASRFTGLIRKTGKEQGELLVTPLEYRNITGRDATPTMLFTIPGNPNKYVKVENLDYVSSENGFDNENDFLAAIEQANEQRKRITQLTYEVASLERAELPGMPEPVIPTEEPLTLQNQFPTGATKTTQINMEDQLKLQQAREAPQAASDTGEGFYTQYYPTIKAEYDARLARNAPDAEYRNILSTSAKDALRKGETWKGKVEAYIASVKAKADAEALAVAPQATPGSGDDLIKALEAKQSFGTIDRLQRGLITREQATAELNGDTSHIKTDMGGLPNPADYAAELKAQGVDRQVSWTKWVQRTQLNPGMDAKDWYSIYDSVHVTPNIPLPPTVAPQVAPGPSAIPPVPVQAATPPIVNIETGKPFSMMLYRGETTNLRDEARGTFLTPSPEVANIYARNTEGSRVSYGLFTFSNPIVFESKKDVGELFGYKEIPANDFTPKQTVSMQVQALRNNLGETAFDDELAWRARKNGYDAIVYTKGEEGAGAVVDLRPVAAPPSPPPPGITPPVAVAAPPIVQSATPPSPPIPPKPPVAEATPAQPEPPLSVGNYQRLVDALNPKKPGFKDSITLFKDSILRKFYADWYPLRKLSKDTGVPADKLTQIVPGSTAAGEDLIRRHFIPAYQSVAKDVKFLEQYMVLRRNEDILARNKDALLPGGIQGANGNTQAMAVLKTKIGDVRFAAIEEAAAKLWAANDNYALKVLLNNGLLSQEAYDAIISNNPHYIPFQRLDFTDGIKKNFTRPEANVTANGIKKMMLEGSERKLDQPLARMQAQIIKAQNLVARNKAAKSIIEALKVLENNTGEKLATLVKDGGEHSAILETISYFEGGHKVTYEVPAIFGNIAKGLDMESGDLLTGIINKFTLPLRLGAVTYNPAFLIVNPIRDAGSALYREKLIPFSPEYIRGWISAIKKDALFSEAAQSGVLMSGIVDTMRSTDAMKRVGQLGSITVRTPADALMVIPRLIEKANVIGEQATRIATFSKLRAQGINALEAAVRARDVTVDFSKSGTVMKVVNQVIPFSNAGLQGGANIVRTMRDKPGWAMAVGAMLGFATLLCRVNNLRFKTSKDIPEYEYTNYYVIQFGEITKSDGTQAPLYIKIPKGSIGSAFTFPVEALFNYATQQNDRSAVEAFLEEGIRTSETVSPVGTDVSGLLPPPLDTGVSLATGTNLYTKLPIVPRAEQYRIPEQQYDANTSAVAVALGKQFKVSPRMIDFAIKDYGAGTAQAGLWLLDLGLNALGYNPEVFGAKELPSEVTTAEALSQAPVTSRFVGTKNTQSQIVGWDDYDKISVDTNRDFANLPDTNRLGIRLGQVGSSINNNELTPLQMAEYQKDMAALVIPGIATFIESEQYKALADDKKKAAIQKRMTALKEQNSVAFLRKVKGNNTPSSKTPTPTLKPFTLPGDIDWSKAIKTPTPTLGGYKVPSFVIK